MFNIYVLWLKLLHQEDGRIFLANTGCKISKMFSRSDMLLLPSTSYIPLFQKKADTRACNRLKAKRQFYPHFLCFCSPILRHFHFLSYFTCLYRCNCNTKISVMNISVGDKLKEACLIWQAHLIAQLSSKWELSKLLQQDSKNAYFESQLVAWNQKA